MATRILYIELKSGYSDNGPAWIVMPKFSNSRQTLYFNNRSLKKLKHPGFGSNYFDIETSEEFWVSGVKKDGKDRHSCGYGPIKIDQECLSEYLKFRGIDSLPKRSYEIVSLANSRSVSSFDALENSPVEDDRVVLPVGRRQYWDKNRRKLNQDY